MEVRRNTIYALFAAITVISKEVLAFLPNIELVTFLMMMFAIHLKLRGTLFIVVLFCFLQVLLYGFGIWSIMYFIVWPSYVCITYCLRNFLRDSYHRMALLSMLFGLIFGFLFSFPYFMISLRMGWIGFLRGVVFDIVHALGNYVIMIVLFDKMNAILKDICIRYQL